jgi:hypothetical protein
MSICPTCNKAVYHAEQVMGPGRVLYHKPCLVCNGCQKRLDPGALQEHDGKPYCRNCHKMMFSPRGILPFMSSDKGHELIRFLDGQIFVRLIFINLKLPLQLKRPLHPTLLNLLSSEPLIPHQHRHPLKHLLARLDRTLTVR